MNKDLLGKCKVLSDYMYLVDKIRRFLHNEIDLDDVIDLAIEECIDENILKDFLIRRRSEVTKVLQIDYTFDRQLQLEREDALTEGRADGIGQGMHLM